MINQELYDNDVIYRYYKKRMEETSNKDKTLDFEQEIDRLLHLIELVSG